MKLFYIVMVFYLLISFLFYRRSDKKLNILFEIIYGIGVLFAFNTVVVYLFGLFDLGGSLWGYSLCNLFVGSVINFISYRKKVVQKYNFSFRSCYLIIVLMLIILGIIAIRTDCFEAIRYESGDAAIHYHMAEYFSRELAFLTKDNSFDLIYGDFAGSMPISYINGGFFLNIFSNISTTKAFVIYDSLCLILVGLLFFSTVYQILELKQKNRYNLYVLLLTLFYVLAFPMNSMIFGFCYLGLSVMVVNLIILTLLNFSNQISKNNLCLIIVLFMLCFSVFFSYYLFMPCIYLGVGIYYIIKWKKKEITFRELLLYGVVTLIIPFIIGFVHFILPGFIDSDKVNVLTAVQLEGYTYDNKTPILLFFMVSLYLIYDRFVSKNKIDWFMISFYTVTGYVFLFFILYLLGYCASYYFYKLFYLYWLFVIIYFSSRLILFRRLFYFLFLIGIILNIFIIVSPSSKVSNLLINSNVYSFNVRTLLEDKLNFNKDEVLLMEKSIEYQDICEHDKRFLMIGDYQKNAWFYSVTGMVPVSDYLGGGNYRIHDEVPLNFKFFEYLTEYDCVVYFYENDLVEIDKNKYDILYENDTGVILKRR